MAEIHEEIKEATSAAPGYEMSKARQHKSRRAFADEEAPAPGFELEAVSTLGFIEAIKAEWRQPTFLQSVVAECIATAIFLFFLILSILPGMDDQKTYVYRIPIVGGFMIMVLVYSFYAVSGGNINPAVSLGLAINGRMSPTRCVCYTAAQIVGAIVGCYMAKVINPVYFNNVSGGANKLIGIFPASGVWIEFMGTFLLVLTVLFATDIAKTNQHSHMTNLIPIPIGMVVMIDHFCLMPYTGCSVNPARSFGSAVTANYWKGHWIWWVGPYAGAAAAAVVYKFIFLPTAIPKKN